MVGPKDTDQKALTERFGERLRSAMKRAGYTSDRSRSGIDPTPLAKRLKVSYEMARRYVEGIAMPRDAKRRSVEKWLNLAPLSLEPTDSRPRTKGGDGAVDPLLLSRCIAALAKVVEDEKVTLDKEQQAVIVAKLYHEAEGDGQVGVAGDATVWKTIVNVLTTGGRK